MAVAIALHLRRRDWWGHQWVASCDQCGAELAVHVDQAAAEQAGRRRGCGVCGTRPPRRRRPPRLAGLPGLLPAEVCPGCAGGRAWQGVPCPACLGRGRVQVVAELCGVPGALARWRVGVREAAARGTATQAARLLPDGRVVYGVAAGVAVLELDDQTRRRTLLGLVDPHLASGGRP
jgi:hypothetical protein